jgi:hypothetical protein
MEPPTIPAGQTIADYRHLRPSAPSGPLRWLLFHLGRREVDAGPVRAARITVIESGSAEERAA